MQRPPSASYRHPLPVRVTHWVNFLVLIVMLGSGLQIFNAHPLLYWGSRSDPDRAWLSIGAETVDGEQRGITLLGDWPIETTGVLGVSTRDNRVETRAFPAWATIPGPQWLAMGRRWHFFFAWLLVLNALVYLLYTGISRHRRELLPTGSELRDLGRSLGRHLNPRRLRAESQYGYNPLQKLSYLLVVAGLGPLIVLTGLTLSPWLNSVFPGLLDLFGGRQSARSLHFLAAFGFVVFFVVHIAMVLVVGPVRHTRAMITGWLRNGRGAP